MNCMEITTAVFEAIFTMNNQTLTINKIYCHSTNMFNNESDVENISI